MTLRTYSAQWSFYTLVQHSRKARMLHQCIKLARARMRPPVRWRFTSHRNGLKILSDVFSKGKQASTRKGRTYGYCYGQKRVLDAKMFPEIVRVRRTLRMYT